MNIMFKCNDREMFNSPIPFEILAVPDLQDRERRNVHLTLVEFEGGNGIVLQINPANDENQYAFAKGDKFIVEFL